jgi:hypothetical protein
MDAYAALDPPVQRAPAIEGKIMAGMGAQQDHYLFQRTLGLPIKMQVGFAGQREMPAVGYQIVRQLLGRSHEIRQAGLDGAARHRVEFRGGRILHQNDAALLLDRPEAKRAVASHSRQDDADTALQLILGKRPEKKVNRQAQPPRRRRGQQVQ